MIHVQNINITSIPNSIKGVDKWDRIYPTVFHCKVKTEQIFVITREFFRTFII